MVAFQKQDLDRPVSGLDNAVISIISLQDTSETLKLTEFSVVFSHIYWTFLIRIFKLFQIQRKPRTIANAETPTVMFMGIFESLCLSPTCLLSQCLPDENPHV